MVKGNEVIYQVFVRNHSQEGTFKAVENDLERIKDLGTDILYLMPIHEIGVEARKGTYGSPYSIKDYFSISPDLGNIEDFKKLVEKTHKLGMKIILDMVFNHTSHDSKLYFDHPDYFFYKNGKPGNRVGDWSDIIDLDTGKKETQDYLISVLQYWIDQGVDGFRFDVASIIDFSFFVRAREELGKKVIFFSESIDFDFVNYLASMGYGSTPDEDSFPVFDVLYNYSWYRPLEHYLLGDGTLEKLVENINHDKKVMPKNYLRANCLENHDCQRIAHLAKDRNQLFELIKFSFFLKGLVFIYAGQEYGIEHKPELFEKDPVDWSKKDEEIYTLYKTLIKEKKNDNNIYDYNIASLDGTNITIELENNNKVIKTKVFHL